MRKFICLLLFAFCSLLGQAAAYEPLWLNDVPAIADRNTHRLYFTLPRNQAALVTAHLTWDETQYSAIAIDGTPVAQAERNLTIEDWHQQGAHTLTTTANDGTTTQWTLVFTNLPLITVDATQSQLFEEWKKDHDLKIPTEITVIDANRRTVESDEDSLITFTSSARIRVRGATSAGKEKKPFALELTDAEGNERDVHLLGFRKDGDWILDAMFNDRLRMRNRLITDIWNAIQDLPYEKDNDYQRNGTDGEFVELFMKGQYWGLYCFTDKIDRKKLNLKKTKDPGLETEVTRGLLWKSLFRCSATTFASYTENPVPGKLTWEETEKDKTWVQKYPDERPEQGYFKPIADMIDCLGRSASDQTFFDSISAKFYIDNLIDYHIFTQALQLQDNLQKNMYLSVRNCTKSERLLITPWDLDASLGRDAGGDEIISNRKWKAFGEQLGGINYLLWRLANTKASDYQKRFYDRWVELKAGVLNLDSIRQRMMAYADLFTTSGAYAREYELWNRKMDADIYNEVNFACRFLADNYACFDDQMKAWGYGEGGSGTPDNPDVPDNPDTPDLPDLPNGLASITQGVQLSEATPVYGKGNAIKFVTMQGDTIYALFTAKPEITFPDNQVQISTADGQQSWLIADVDYWTFCHIDNPDPAAVKFTAANKQGSLTPRYYRLDGTAIAPEHMTRGVYIMKLGDTSIKFIKK